MQSLKEELKDWQDFDGTMYALALKLGILNSGDTFQEYKWIFCSRNKLGDFLDHILSGLVDQGCLLYDTNNSQFKWNEDYTPEFTDTSSD